MSGSRAGRGQLDWVCRSLRLRTQLLQQCWMGQRNWSSDDVVVVIVVVVVVVVDEWSCSVSGVKRHHLQWKVEERLTKGRQWICSDPLCYVGQEWGMGDCFNFNFNVKQMNTYFSKTINWFHFILFMKL